MKQITEDYCSFEIAQLLKEKGFDEYCLFCYEQNVFSHTTNFTLERALYREILIGIKNSEFEENAIHNVFTAPSQSRALKWLREVHHYYIQIMLDSWACGDHLGYYVVIQKTDSDFEIMLQDAVDEVFYQTYEEACEAALKYTLENLI
jgi:hypothetical protein